MPTQEIISVNFWQIVISLCNLLIMYFILKKFLFKPVKKVLDERQKTVDGVYEKAEKAQKTADENRDAWQTRLNGVEIEADEIIKDASRRAGKTEERMISEAKRKADGIINSAKNEAALEKEKAAKEIKSQIAGISVEIAEKLMERELKSEDQERLIESFIDEMGKDE